MDRLTLPGGRMELTRTRLSTDGKRPCTARPGLHRQACVHIMSEQPSWTVGIASMRRNALGRAAKHRRELRGRLGAGEGKRGRALGGGWQVRGRQGRPLPFAEALALLRRRLLVVLSLSGSRVPLCVFRRDELAGLRAPVYLDCLCLLCHCRLLALCGGRAATGLT